MDNKLIQGLLIGSCLLLLFATIMTVVDITHYRGAPAISAAEPVSRQPQAAPVAPVSEPEAEAEPVTPPAEGAPAGAT